MNKAVGFFFYYYLGFLASYLAQRSYDLGV